ncbi:MAG TPA: cupin domain-containing protein [Polyangiaceae bacterium]
MAKLVSTATRIQAAGNKPKEIAEYIGRVNTDTEQTSVAYMKSPAGWLEPGQTPAFDEYTVVVRGMLRVEDRSQTHDVHAGQAVVAPAGEWVRYGSPGAEGAEYIAVCVPAFSPDTVNRDG